MSLLKRMLGSPRVDYRPDSFTLSSAGKYLTLCQWLRDLQQRQRPVVMLCHFESTFLEVQHELEHQAIDYEILAQAVTRPLLMREMERAAPRPLLTISSMLQSGPSAASGVREGRLGSIAMIALERYPRPARDEHVEDFARSLGCPVQLGYLLSFEDPLLRHLLGRDFIELMEQLGLRGNNLVTSAMSSRAVSRAIRRRSRGIVNEVSARSPQEWLAANGQKSQR
jgi:hypothetical protein